MSPTLQGSLVLVVTLLMLVSGIPVAFGLGAIAIIFLNPAMGTTGSPPPFRRAICRARYRKPDRLRMRHEAVHHGRSRPSS